MNYLSLGILLREILHPVDKLLLDMLRTRTVVLSNNPELQFVGVRAPEKKVLLMAVDCGHTAFVFGLPNGDHVLLAEIDHLHEMLGTERNR